MLECVGKPLTLLEIPLDFLQMGSLRIVDPPGIASPKLCSGDEWNRVGDEFLRQGVVSIIDRSRVPMVGGQAIFVGAVRRGKDG